MHLLPLALLFFPGNADTLLVDLSLAAYAASLFVLVAVSAQGLVLVVLHYVPRRDRAPEGRLSHPEPFVTIQLPLFNELYVAERLIRAVCAMDYPLDRLQIQVLDDSTDGTVDLVASLVDEYRREGVTIDHIRRTERVGFKAGALENGLRNATGEFIAIFDADFVPNPGFLRDTLPCFADGSVGMVQTRWEHLNETYSMLTKAQAFAFDAHFAIEQRVRSMAGHFLTFNGTGGIWRRSAIVDAGGWQADTLTEDLDLSFRAQLRGWRLIFRHDVTSPAELPADFNSLKTQQYRWTKGYIQTARKILPRVWSSPLPLSRKILSTLHLSGNVAFPLVLVVAVLNTPIALVRSAGSHDLFFAGLWIFMLGFTSTLVFHLQAQRIMHKNWVRRMAYYPVFLAGSMGLAVSNSRAVLDGLFAGQNTFLRTPKYAVRTPADTWSDKMYTSPSFERSVLVEILLALYCFFGVVFSLYQLDFSAVPFQLLFATGFSLAAGLSIRHAIAVRRSTRPQI